MQTDILTGGVEMVLSIPKENAYAAKQIAQEAAGKKLRVSVAEYKRKRSLDANAYFWVLCDKLAEAMNLKKVEVYRNAIREIGGVSTVGCFKDEDAEDLCRLWALKGLGWITDSNPSKLPGCTNITFYKGSSAYDTDQMSRLIDNVIQDAQAVGIETKTPEECARLIEDWGR
jgi:hypothetical protein